MKIKLFDDDENKVEYDIEMWDCMKIGFFSYIGWIFVGIIFSIILFVISTLIAY